LAQGYNGNVDIQGSHVNGIGTIVVSSGLQNNGVIGKTDFPAKVFSPDAITIDMFGNAFYRDQPFKMVTHARVFALYFYDKRLKDDCLLYIASSMSYLSKVFSYSNMASYEKVKGMTVVLPFGSEEDIDVAFMRRYIATLKAERVATLKAERVATLKAYLQATGLADTQLTEEEKNVLNKPVATKAICMREIFEIQKGKRLTKQDMRPGSTNFIGAISSNNGIRQKIDAPRTWQPNCITVNYNGSVGYSFYQEEPFYASDDVNVLYLKEHTLNRNIALYFCSAIYKYALKHSYSSKWTKEKMLITPLIVPVTATGAIDYAFMEAYISAQTKLCIRSLMEAKDIEIAATESIVEKPI